MELVWVWDSLSSVLGELCVWINDEVGRVLVARFKKKLGHLISFFCRISSTCRGGTLRRHASVDRCCTERQVCELQMSDTKKVNQNQGLRWLSRNGFYSSN